MNLPSVSHRDLAVTPPSEPKVIRQTFRFSTKQLKEMEKVRKTTYGKERTTAINHLAKEWAAPVGSVMYRVYRGGAPNKLKVQRRNAAPARKKKTAKPGRPQKIEEQRTTKLRFKIKSLEINGSEIVMTLIS